MSFEESLVCHAAPTLASIKIANLYNFRFASEEECQKSIAYFNSIMNLKGIYVELLKNSGDFYLIYVYRKSQLEKKLEDNEVKKLLIEYGYPMECEINKYLNYLKLRLNDGGDFPHEIGLLLGYPVADVRAFIETKGKDYISCGVWQVYGDEEAAKCQFCKYKHCEEIYKSVYGAGRKFEDMLVSA